MTTSVILLGILAIYTVDGLHFCRSENFYDNRLKPVNAESEGSSLRSGSPSTGRFGTVYDVGDWTWPRPALCWRLWCWQRGGKGMKALETSTNCWEHVLTSVNRWRSPSVTQTAYRLREERYRNWCMQSTTCWRSTNCSSRTSIHFCENRY